MKKGLVLFVVLVIVVSTMISCGCTASAEIETTTDVPVIDNYQADDYQKILLEHTEKDSVSQWKNEVNHFTEARYQGLEWSNDFEWFISETGNTRIKIAGDGYYLGPLLWIMEDGTYEITSLRRFCSTSTQSVSSSYGAPDGAVAVIGIENPPDYLRVPQ